MTVCDVGVVEIALGSMLAWSTFCCIERRLESIVWLGS